jgi:hypothetical protein
MLPLFALKHGIAELIMSAQRARRLVKMADYYALIKKAVASSSSRESRRALYERARAAQLTQLLAICPPLSKTEITCEQLALEEALHKVETEATPAPVGIPVPLFNDLVIAADNIGKPIVRFENHSSVVQATRPANWVSPVPAIKMPQPMTVKGDATGRLIKYWRWHARLPVAASKLGASQ